MLIASNFILDTVDTFLLESFCISLVQQINSSKKKKKIINNPTKEDTKKPKTNKQITMGIDEKGNQI